ncbi:hypothetical protein DAPPUDRAFT_247705 [Daphnia pulex]|uniref:Uncharacterized protein n=1 Tax=Daphnia pulex TaxID=6669 RepID=E9GT85_DAPPU|nr:hypothetical protein DAPPUDRAFT_247705 [Daphnia pulex]|eukprot:EFX77402.1 hypothetical protein DAPPUDRAFT_247705 [Daphnia pulex]
MVLRTDVPSKRFVADPPRSLNESIANIRAYATKLVDDNRNSDIVDGQRQGWKLFEVLFPIEFYELTGATPPLALQKSKPKSKWEIQRAEKLEREALALLTPEQKFVEDEALIRRDKEAKNALRQEVRAAKKRKRDAVEEAKIRLVEKEAKEKREAYERSKRRRVDTPRMEQRDLLHRLKTALAAGNFVIPGTASDPITSEILEVLSRHKTPVKEPPPSATTSQAQTPQPLASTSQVKGAKAPRRQPAAGRKKAEASKEVQAQILNPPAPLSPISPKPTKGKALVRPKSRTILSQYQLDGTPGVTPEGRAEDAIALKQVTVFLERYDVIKPTPAKTPKPRKKSLFNPPSKELVEAATKQSAWRKSLRSAKEVEVNLADSAKNLYGEDLEELPSEKEDELLKEPAQVSAAAQAAEEQQTRPVPIRSGLRIDSGDESEPELQLTAEDDEVALKEAALSTLPKAVE